MEIINRTVSVSNILSLETFWQDVKRISYVVSHCLDVVCTRLNHNSTYTYINTHKGAGFFSAPILVCLTTLSFEKINWLAQFD